MAFEILIRAPVHVPTGMDEESFAAQRAEIDFEGLNRAARALCLAGDDAIEIRQRLELKLGQVFAVCVTVKRAVEIRAGIRDHVDPADLEFCPARVTRA